MQPTSRTTAIIPNFNGGVFLTSCVEALMAQEPAPPDIIIVDNNSSDGSHEAVREKYPVVKIIRMDRNTGFGFAVNTGVRETKTEYVALVNNDAFVQPGWLSSLEKFMDEHPEAGACAPKALFDTGEGIIDCAGDESTPYGFVFKRGHFQKDNGQFDNIAEVFSVSAVATIYRKSMFNEIGLFDENYFAYYEDIDLCFRARLFGMKFYCLPSAIVFHHYSATSGKKVKLGTEEVYLHLTGTWIKNAPAGLLLKRAPSIILFHLFVIAAFLLARFSGKSRLPKVPFFRFMTAMLKQRKKIQSRWKITTTELESAFTNINVWRAIFSRAAKAVGAVKQ